MSLEVEVHESSSVNKEDMVVGKITFDGKTLSIFPDNTLMRNLIREDISVPVSDEERVLIKPSESEKFICNLHRVYRNHYLWVSRAKQI